MTLFVQRARAHGSGIEVRTDGYFDARLSSAECARAQKYALRFALLGDPISLEGTERGEGAHPGGGAARRGPIPASSWASVRVERRARSCFTRRARRRRSSRVSWVLRTTEAPRRVRDRRRALPRGRDRPRRAPRVRPRTSGPLRHARSRRRHSPGSDRRREPRGPRSCRARRGERAHRALHGRGRGREAHVRGVAPRAVETRRDDPLVRVACLAVSSKRSSKAELFGIESWGLDALYAPGRSRRPTEGASSSRTSMRSRRRSNSPG